MSGSVSKVKMLCGSLCHHIHHYASPKVQQTVCNLALNQLQYGQLTHLAAPGINYKSQIKDVLIYFIFSFQIWTAVGSITFLFVPIVGHASSNMHLSLQTNH